VRDASAFLVFATDYTTIEREERLRKCIIAYGKTGRRNANHRKIQRPLFSRI